MHVCTLLLPEVHTLMHLFAKPNGKKGREKKRQVVNINLVPPATLILVQITRRAIRKAEFEFCFFNSSFYFDVLGETYKSLLSLPPLTF